VEIWRDVKFEIPGKWDESGYIVRVMTMGYRGPRRSPGSKKGPYKVQAGLQRMQEAGVKVGAFV